MWDSSGNSSIRRRKGRKGPRKKRRTASLRGSLSFWKTEGRASGKWRVVLPEDGESYFWKMESRASGRLRGLSEEREDASEK